MNRGWFDRSWSPWASASKLKDLSARDIAPRQWAKGAEDFRAQHNRNERILIEDEHDLFSQGAHCHELNRLLALINETPEITWLLVTRNTYGATRELSSKQLPPNLWIGVTASTQDDARWVIPLLSLIQASRKFILLSGLRGPVDLNDTEAGDVMCHCSGCLSMTPHSRLDWVIVEGDTSKTPKPLNPHWLQALAQQCETNDVPLYFSGWGRWGTRSYLMGSGIPVFREFSSYVEWTQKAPSRVHGGTCIDMKGRVLNQGIDFIRARDELAFPVTVFDRMSPEKSGWLLDGKVFHQAPADVNENAPEYIL